MPGTVVIELIEVVLTERKELRSELAPGGVTSEKHKVRRQQSAVWPGGVTVMSEEWLMMVRTGVWPGGLISHGTEGRKGLRR